MAGSDIQSPETKNAGVSRMIAFPAMVAQLKTFANGKVAAVLSTNASELSKLLKLITACQAGNSLFLSAQIVKPKPVKKDAKKKPDPQKGPRRVRRYPYRD